MKIIRLSISGLLAGLMSLPLNADDTEIFRQPPQVSSPNIMIVFDDSGSMRTNVSNQRIKFSEFTPPNTSSESVSSNSYSSDYLYFSLKNEVEPRSDDKNRRIKASEFCSEAEAPSVGEKKTIDRVTYINQRDKERSLSRYKPKRFTELKCGSAASSNSNRRSENVVFYSASYLNNLFDQSVADDSSGPYLYWSTDGTVPTWNSSQRFNASLNRCASAIDALYGDDQVGLFSTIGLGGYGPSINGQVNAWRSLGEIPSDSLLHVDCSNDYVNELTGWDSSTSGIAAETAAAGYPQQDDQTPYTATRTSPPASFAGATTLYTEAFVYWYHQNTTENKTYSRLEIAQDVVNTLVRSRDGDFGLSLLNYEQGGRIVRPIGPKNQTNIDNVEDLILSPKITDDGWTPLCETHYELYRYLTGSQVFLANFFATDELPAKGFDGDNQYIPPVADCDEDVYIIYLTDGEPTRDGQADDKIKALTGGGCDGSDGCWSELAGYMADNDLVTGTGSEKLSKRAYTYAIGFVDSSNSSALQKVFEPVTEAGKGRYYSASSYLEIFNAFQAIYNDIVDRDSTFTSPSVAVNSFKRTESLNDVFFQMFTPSSEQSDWRGNLKKLQIQNGTDSNDQPCSFLASQDFANESCENSAFANGSVKPTVSTFWSSQQLQDGDRVSEGGFGQILLDRGADDRVFYTNWVNPDSAEVLCDINKPGTTCGVTSGGDFGPEVPDGLFDLNGTYASGVSGATEFQTFMDYVRGYNVAGVTDHWMVGDAVHARAVVVNYGVPGNSDGSQQSGCSFDSKMPDTRVLFATNSGVLHFINNRAPHDPWDNNVERCPTLSKDALPGATSDYDGKEAWAFFPAELIETAAKRYLNEATTEPVYGLDATPSIYTLDLNNDGTLDHSAGDKVYALISMRRGGRMIYALDISNPDAPEFLWKVEGGAGELVELGQTWSVPQIAKIPGYSDTSGNPKPVLILGAGYDDSKDTQGVSATADAESMGRGLYILDMETGAVVWSLTHDGGSGTHELAEDDLDHSVPATVTTVDSNGDGKIDRVYWPDTGGQIWRLDMPWSDTLGKNWSWHKVASLNGSVNGTNTADISDDRRFFNQIDFVPTTGPVSVCEKYASTTPTWGVCATDSGYTTLDMGYDALLIGSGDRTNPLATDVQNRFYMIRDLGISTYETALGTCDFTQTVEAVNFDFRCLGTLTGSELADLTLDSFKDGEGDELGDADFNLAEAEYSADQAALRKKAGWRINLQASGEKALSASVSLKGTVFFTTFTPGQTVTGQCGVEYGAGLGRLYMVDMHDARGRLLEEADDEEASGSRFRTLGSVLPDTPSIHVGEEGDMNLIFPSGGDDDDNIENSNVSLPAPQGVYWYQSLEVN